MPGYLYTFPVLHVPHVLLHTGLPLWEIGVLARSSLFALTQLAAQGYLGCGAQWCLVSTAHLPEHEGN